jgi:putative ABC transport system permease protein
MRPDDRELDDEIRGHLALSVKERIENGENPEAARLAAMREFGYVPAIRESMRRVWFSRWFDAAAALGRDMRVALRSLLRAKGLAATVVVTLALGIGANAGIFSVVRGVLLRPLVNRDEDRLIYIRQSAPGLDTVNTKFSVPEIDDFKSRVTTVSAFGDFSVVEFTLIGLGGEPRVVRAGVVGGRYFDVMGLRPVLGRLLNAHDDGPTAAGAAVLTYRFWTTLLNSDPGAIGKTIRFGPRTATVVGVLEPSVPYPADTEIIANVVTSPHHLGATMVTNALVPAVTRVIREISPEQPVERPSTLEDVRAEVMSPDRMNAFVFSGFAGIALLIAVVGVAGVLAFSVSARTREFGVRLAVGSAPQHLMAGVLREGVVIAAIGIAAGAAGGYVLARVAAGFFASAQMPGVLPVLGAAAVLIGAAAVASLIPAARASRVDVLQALRSE